MIEAGDRLFDFALENQYGETITSTGLSHGPVLLVFYPWAFSRVCGAELAGIQDNYDFFASHGVRVAAISVDHKFTLRSYAESLGAQFDLLADFWPHGAVARAAGAFDEQRGVATRLSLLVVDGIVQKTFTSAMTQARSMDGYQQAVREVTQIT